MFCRPCVIQYLVKQKQKIADNLTELDKVEKRQLQQKRDKEIEAELKKMEEFEKYDGFAQITDRTKLIKGEDGKPSTVPITKNDVKPIGIYELNSRKAEYVKTAFWTL